MVKFGSASISKDKKSATASSGCIILFGLAFALAGGVFTFFVAKDFLNKLDARGWNKYPAKLIDAEVEVSRKDDSPFTIKTAYTYNIDGLDYAGTKYALKDKRSDEYEELALKVKALRENSKLVAHVNPKDPTEAVLNPGSLWSGFFIFFPLIFVAVGAGCIYGGIAISRKAKKQKAGKTESISSNPTKKSGGAWIGVLLGVICTAVGIGLLFPLAIKPFKLSKSAKDWPETPCKVIWAKVKSHDSDDGTTYSVDIFYSYEFNGQKHRSNRYGFIGGSSSGHSGKKKVVDEYRKAKAPVCFVDPSLPERAVLKRELGGGMFLGLVPIVFLLIGIPLAVYSFRIWLKDSSGPKGRDGSPGHFMQPHGNTSSSAPSVEPKTLSPGKARIGMAIGLLLFGLFWNAMVFGFLFPEAWIRNEGGIFLKLFSLPFLLVGIGIALGFFYTLLALFNPKPILTITPGDPALGSEAKLQWKMKGSTTRVRQFRIILKGIERATYVRGTDTVTEERTFYATVLNEQSHAMSMHEGEADFSIPLDLMYSFETASNNIVWRFEVKGEIPFWPNISDKFDLTVRPPASTPDFT